MSLRRVPCIESPCPSLPANPDHAASVWCARCAQPVHNLSALDLAAQERLLATPGKLCVSYSMRVLASAAALLGTGQPGVVLAQDSADDSMEMERIVVTGGGRRPFQYETVFLETAPPATATDPPAAPEPPKPPG